MGKMEPEFLKDMPKKGPFEVPEGYFVKLHDDIAKRIRRKNELPVLPPAASAGPVFRVPPAYFDSLPARISARTAAFDIPLSEPAKNGSELTAGNDHGTRRAVEQMDIQAAGARKDRYYKTAVAACIILLLSIFSVIQVEKTNDPAGSVVNIADFDEEILVQEYLESTPSAGNDQYGEMEGYFLDQVDESLLLQEL